MKKLLKNILIFISYFIYEYLFIILLTNSGLDYYKLNMSNKIILLLIFNIIYVFTLVFFYYPEIKKDFKDYKKNYKQYLKKYVSIYILGIILMAFSNIILQYITKLELSGNEENIRLLIKKYPLYIAFSSIIYAPFVEEIVFRKIIKNIIDKKYIFIVLSGIVFGALHISDYSNINQILMGIPYIIMGIDFAYIYYKTNNIFTTMTFHLCHNLILFLLQLI